ncbi:MAG: ABC transporter permease [Lachnospiraceae bacterium]|nr:ABC transporter permease [Lachnospiraceae bacterium]
MKKLFVRLYFFVMFLFMYLPIIVLIGLSFNASRARTVWGGFTLEWYAELFQDSVLLTSLFNTLSIALISAAVSTLIAVPAAIGLLAMKRRHASVIQNFGNIPMLNPDIVTGIILMLLLSSAMKLGYVSILLAHITFNIPYVLLSVLPSLKKVNISIFEAARDLGAGSLYAFIKVVLPEIMPGILSGFFMAITLSMDDFVVTYFTRGAGIDTLSTLVYGQLKRGIKPEMYALSSVIFITVLLALVAFNILSSASERGSYEGSKANITGDKTPLIKEEEK